MSEPSERVFVEVTVAAPVDAYGDGLIVMTRRPASAEGGGRASATVIAYHLDDTAFAAV